MLPASNYFKGLPNKTFSRINQFIKNRIDRINTLQPKYKMTLPCFLFRSVNTWTVLPPGKFFFAVIRNEPMNIPMIPANKQEMYPMITHVL